MIIGLVLLSNAMLCSADEKKIALPLENVYIVCVKGMVDRPVTDIH